MTAPAPTPTAGRRRAGFTLIEMLVVILIIGVLVALLVPVIFSAVRTANEARVTAEINLLAQSLASFKSAQGDYPPSRIILREDGYYDVRGDATGTTWASAAYVVNTSYIETQNIGGIPLTPPNTPLRGSPDLTYGRVAERSVRWLRKFFPRVNFSTTTRLFAPNATAFHDFNGNGFLDEGAILLEGHECLAFFLGGIPNRTGTTLSGMGGFGPNPVNPFVAEAFAQNNRKRPLFDFDASRLIDDDGDGIPGYVDPLAKNESSRYYAYFSAYGGGGYDPNDVNFAINNPEDDRLTRRFRVSFNVPDPSSPDRNQNRIVNSPAPNPYTSSPALPGGIAVASYVSGETFQLLSAGTDRLYGTGGQYLSNANSDRLPLDTTVNGAITDLAGNPVGANIRQREADNLTSFGSGKLD